MKNDEDIRVYELKPATLKFPKGFLWDTFTGLLVYAVFFGVAAFFYVGIFGYCGGHFIHYALAETISMPISFDTCFKWGLFPVLNFVGFLIAAYILMWKVLFYLGWNLLLWLLDVLPPFLQAWSNNLK